MDERQGGPRATQASQTSSSRPSFRAAHRLYDLLGESLTADEICRRALGIVSEDLALDHCELWLLEPGGRTLRLAARSPSAEASASPRRTLEATPVVPIEDGFAGRAAASGRPVERARACALPLVSRGTALGALVVAASDQRSMPAGALQEAAEALARLITVARAQHESIRERLFRYERLALVGQIAASAAHEINNVLTNILLRTHKIAGSEDLPQALRESVKLLEAEAERIAALASGLLQPVRAKRRAREPVDLGAVVRRTLHLIAPVFSKSRRIRVETRFAPDLPAVLGEPSEMEQVFTNLILNAVQAMSGGGSLALFTRLVEDRVVAGVRDTGPGIASDVLPHLFEPFFTTRSAEGGTGLGLALVKEIVKGHGGEIEVETAPGEGTEFRIVLPRAPAS